ncbi:hypothetical protein J4Q44_G00059170 [Coregonus suidteri]|uniref:Uncharacterized protein n=1 Tax=Coregonus suidteri TaxID=861788 RepID=A0AAN8M2L4_9TELE
MRSSRYISLVIPKANTSFGCHSVQFSAANPASATQEDTGEDMRVVHVSRLKACYPSAEELEEIECRKVLNIFEDPETEVLKSNEGKAKLTREIKMRVLNYLNDKYTDPETDELLTMATFLDPRFNTTYMTTEKLVKVRAASETEALLQTVRLILWSGESCVRTSGIKL